MKVSYLKFFVYLFCLIYVLKVHYQPQLQEPCFTNVQHNTLFRNVH